MGSFEELKKAHEILGIPMGSTRSQIKTAYTKIIRKNHPDRLPIGERDGASKKTAEINAAYSLIWESGPIEETQDGKEQPEEESERESSEKEDGTTFREGSLLKDGKPGTLYYVVSIGLIAFVALVFITLLYIML